MRMISPNVFATPDNVVALDRLGDEIAELSAHLEAGTACLLDLIRVSGLPGQEGACGGAWRANRVPDL
jgi:hypothetical protein